MNEFYHFRQGLSPKKFLKSIIFTLGISIFCFFLILYTSIFSQLPLLSVLFLSYFSCLFYTLTFLQVYRFLYNCKDVCLVFSPLYIHVLAHTFLQSVDTCYCSIFSNTSYHTILLFPLILYCSPPSLSFCACVCVFPLYISKHFLLLKALPKTYTSCAVMINKDTKKDKEAGKKQILKLYYRDGAIFLWMVCER